MTANGRLIVFDWNGTLFDDLRHSHGAFNAVLARFGVPALDEAWYQEEYTVPFIQLYEAAGCDAKALLAREQEVHATFHAAYDEAAKTATLRTGAKELLHFLQDHKMPMVVLSNHTLHDIEFQGTRLGIRHYFDAILANEVNGTGYKIRGKDQRLKRYMAERDLAGGVIVGDSVEEIEIGRDFGLLSIAITGGMCSEARLRAAQPNHLVHSLHELQPILLDRGFAA